MKRIKYFSLAEFINSVTAKRLKINNIPTFEIVDNLNRLASYLDGIREKLGKPILITSGYRCPMLNKAVGGVANSQHQKGLAADITCSDMKSLEKILIETGGFDQLIKEHRKGNPNIYWFHVSICNRFGTSRNQIIMNLEKK